LERQTKVLVDKTQPRDKRVEALKFVIHFVGDLHQPLHCADRNGDRGGNTRLVFFLDRRKADSLHYVWDTALVREIVGQRAIAPVAEAMSKTITPAQRKEWPSGTPSFWANETHRVAVERVYAMVAEAGDPQRLGRDYVTGATPVVGEQIKRAGVRLAALLNLYLASADSPTSRPATARADTGPATQPDESLMRELVRAVEMAQQKIRSTPPPAPPPPKNTLQQSRATAAPDVLKPVADSLVGKSGSIAVQVVDVYDNMRNLVFGAPPEVMRTYQRVPYLVVAECENPTATYLSDAQQRAVREARDRGDATSGARVRERAAAGKPAHRVWIPPDDKAVQEWARGTRKYLHGEIVGASLGRTPLHDYVKVDIVLKLMPAPDATTEPARPH
jgi:hypothetical protein